MSAEGFEGEFIHDALNSVRDDAMQVASDQLHDVDIAFHAPDPFFALRLLRAVMQADLSGAQHLATDWLKKAAAEYAEVRTLRAEDWKDLA